MGGQLSKGWSQERVVACESSCDVPSCERMRVMSCKGVKLSGRRVIQQLLLLSNGMDLRAYCSHKLYFFQDGNRQGDSWPQTHETHQHPTHYHYYNHQMM